MFSKEILRLRNKSEQITALPLEERTINQIVREKLASENYYPEQVVGENRDMLQHLSETPFRSIGQKFVKGEPLTFQEAFLGMTFVVSATNRGIFNELKGKIQKAHGMASLDQSQLLGPAQTFLTSMAQREVMSTLTPAEVAGMTASTMMDINLRLGFKPDVLETGGMGGDKGFIVNGVKKKVINASTLSGVVLSSMEVPVLKHGSYANTSAVGSTDAIEALGVNIYQDSFEEIQKLFEKTRFYFSDAHISKTIHDLSHSPFMRHETVNHIIGPMTPPVEKNTVLNKVIGVNEGVHPSTIAQAYEELNWRGYQKIGNVAVVSGLDQNFDPGMNLKEHANLKPHMMLDELSPYYSLVGLVQNGKNIGDYIVRPEDFGIDLEAGQIQTVNNERELLAANGQALQGISGANADYLAMNAAIGLFTARYLGLHNAIQNEQINRVYLRECFNQCKDEIESGRAAEHLKNIVSLSNSYKR
jgi:anthranilate phosphoribosyltransferase